MISGDLLSYVDYFRQWANSNPDVKFFMYGSVEKGIEYARGFEDFEYPFVWLEQPTITMDDNGMSSFNMTYFSGISVLIQAPLDDREAQIIASDAAHKIMMDLLKKVNHDRKDDIIMCEIDGAKIEAVSQLWADSHYGWRLEFKPMLNVNKYLC
jgi:hypothetical protein